MLEENGMLQTFIEKPKFVLNTIHRSGSNLLYLNSRYFYMKLKISRLMSAH